MEGRILAVFSQRFAWTSPEGLVRLQRGRPGPSPGCLSQQIRGAAKASVFLTSSLRCGVDMLMVQVPHFENEGEAKI